MKRTLSKVAIAAVMISGMALQASEAEGKALFEAKCAVCHSLSKPTDKSKIVAPPARGVMFHLSEAFKTQEEIKAHINDFVMEPSAEKAICKSVKRFGVMPSQKGAVSKEELEIISEWMLEHLRMDKKEHQKMEQGHKRGQGQGRKLHRESFAQFDTDGDGKLSPEEFEAMRAERRGQKRRGMQKQGKSGCGGNCGGNCNRK